MKTYDLSIIIPIFNTSIYLKKCIDSIISQQIFNNIELLLINDGSSDASEKICKEYCEKYNNIKYFYQKNQGVASARNLGLFNAKGEYIYFIDSDDTIANDFFMEFSNVNVKNKYDIVIVATDNFNQSKRSVSKITTCPTWGAIIRKKILEKHHIKFFTGLQNTEDNLFFYQLLTFTNSIYKLLNIITQ